MKIHRNFSDKYTLVDLNNSVGIFYHIKIMFKSMSPASSLQGFRNIYAVVALLLWFENGGLSFVYRVPGVGIVY